MSVKHYFLFKGTTKTVPEETVMRVLRDRHDHIVKTGIAICVENKCEEVKEWMVEDYLRENNIPAVPGHLYLRALANEWMFRYPHLGSLQGVNLSFELAPEGIILRDVELNGVKYSALEIKLYKYTSVILYNADKNPQKTDYYDLLPTKHT